MLELAAYETSLVTHDTSYAYYDRGCQWLVSAGICVEASLCSDLLFRFWFDKAIKPPSIIYHACPTIYHPPGIVMVV